MVSHMGGPPLQRQPSLNGGGAPSALHSLQFQTALQQQLGISNLTLSPGSLVTTPGASGDRPERRSRLRAASPLARTSPPSTSPSLDHPTDRMQTTSPLLVAPLRRRRSGIPPQRPPSPDGAGGGGPGSVGRTADSDGDLPDAAAPPKKRRTGATCLLVASCPDITLA